MACEVCRVKKIKCDSGKPSCKYCKDHGLPCKFQPRAKRRLSLHAVQEMEERLKRVEGALRAYQERDSENNKTSPQGSLIHADASGTSPLMEVASVAGQSQEVECQESNTSDTAGPPPESTPLEDLAVERTLNEVEAINNVDSHSDRRVEMIDRILWQQEHRPFLGGEFSSFIAGEHGQEFLGLPCNVPMLSTAGRQWVSRRADGAASLDNINNLLCDMMFRLKRPVPSPVAVPEELRANLPPSDVAKNYVNAYFDKLQVVWPLLCRPQFTERCEAFWSHRSSPDVCWYALYCVVLALGCRAFHSHGSPTSIQQSELKALKLFENAVSVQSRLLYEQTTTVQTVQTFSLMAIFTHGIAGVQTEYVHCAIAVRLATSLGMHQQAPRWWDLSSTTREERSVVFWSLYSLDKMLAFRSGRPAAIHDADISCPFPHHAFSRYVVGKADPETPEGEFDFFLVFTQLTRIMTKIYRDLYSPAAFARSSSDIVEAICTLYAELESWKQSALSGPRSVEPGRVLRESEFPSTVVYWQITWLHMAYYDCLLNLEKASRPSALGEWSVHKLRPDYAERLANVIGAGYDAARNICLATQYMEVESYTSAWLVVYYPMGAVTTLFVNIITNPQSGSALNDIALMEVAMGLFGRVEFMTSGRIRLTFLGELTKIARHVIEERKFQASSECSGSTSRPDQFDSQGFGGAVCPTIDDLILSANNYFVNPSDDPGHGTIDGYSALLELFPDQDDDMLNWHI